MAMDKNRYQKKAQEKARRDQETARPVKNEPAVKSNKNEPVQQEPAKKQAKSKENGFWINGEAAEKLRLTMMHQSEMMQQMAALFGNDAQSEPEPDDEPEVEPEDIPKVKSKQEMKPEPKPEPAKKPAAKSAPEPERDEEPVLESGCELVRVYRFLDPETGEILYASSNDFWTACQFSHDDYDRVWVWLENGQFIKEAMLSEVRAYYPGLFL